MKRLVRRFLGVFKSIYVWAETEDVLKQKETIKPTENTEPKKFVPNNPQKKEQIMETEEQEDEVKTVRSVWDYLRFNENTQAFHLNAVTNFDEWVDMDEIRRRVLELYGVSYKNEKSLYPYLKTLTDVGLFETVSAGGGRRKWRKKSILIIVEKESKERSEIKAKNKEKQNSSN